MRLIRLDDFPHGRPFFGTNYRSVVSGALEIFNHYNIPYILGISPYLMTMDDFNFLNKTIKTGWACLHGFNHKFDFKPWSNITSTWPLGGEFAGMTEDEINNRYDIAKKMLDKIERTKTDHFIAPFNCYNQSALNVLSQKGIKYLHTCDKEYNDFGYEKMDYKGIIPVISKFKVTYDYAYSVINHLEDPSQITLHWIFDSERRGWAETYIKFAEALLENSNNTGERPA